MSDQDDALIQAALRVGLDCEGDIDAKLDAALAHYLVGPHTLAGIVEVIDGLRALVSTEVAPPPQVYRVELQTQVIMASVREVTAADPVEAGRLTLAEARREGVWFVPGQPFEVILSPEGDIHLSMVQPK